MSQTPLHIVHTESSLGWGGQEIRILTEAEGMQRRGHRITLIAPAEARIFQEASKHGIEAVSLPIGRKNLRGLWALWRWLRQHPCDVINTHSSTDSWLVAIAKQLTHSLAPMVRTRHISAPIPVNRASHWLYQHATAHIATTGETLRQQLIRQNGYVPESITSVPTGIDTVRYSPGDQEVARAQLGLPKNIPIIGIVATLRSWKGHSYLLKAFAQLNMPEAKLLIVGDGPQRDNLKAEIAQLGLDARVHMPGNQNDVVPWMRAMDIFVLPSYANEGVPQALMQAMACGLPVISTPIGSITEAVADGVSGYIVPARDETAMQQAMHALLSDQALRERMGLAARLIAEEKFGLDTMLDKMEAIFTQVVQHG